MSSSPQGPGEVTPPPARARIALVDDHPLLRSGVVHLINAQTDMEVAFDVDLGRAMLERLEHDQPDLIVVDLSMPEINGLELLQRVKQRYPQLRVLVLSMHDETLYAQRVIAAGAAGYVMKNLGAEQLLLAIRRVLAGKKHLSDPLCAQLLGTLPTHQPHRHRSPIELLTDREFEVLELIGRGKNSREIGEQLGISPKTVDVHRVRLRNKLELRDAAALMRYALRWDEVLNV